MKAKNLIFIYFFSKRHAHLNRQKDTELLKLKKYLKDIATHCDDFTKLSHRKWEKYNPKSSQS